MFIVIGSGSISELFSKGKKPNKKNNAPKIKRKKEAKSAKKKPLSLKEWCNNLSAIIYPFSLLIGLMKNFHEIIINYLK